MEFGDSILPELPPAVYPGETHANRSNTAGMGQADPTICYGMEVETVPGKWSWRYGSMPFTACASLQNSAGLDRHVVCCDMQLCNKPDRTLDAVTQVGWLLWSSRLL